MLLIKATLLICFFCPCYSLVAQVSHGTILRDFELDSNETSFSSKKDHSLSLVERIELNKIYSISSFSWSIAGPKNVPNVLSELVWKNLQSYGVSMNAKLRFTQIIAPLITVHLEKNLKGTVTDKDFTADNRQEIGYSRDFDSQDGYYRKLSLLQPINRKQNLFIGLSSSFQKLIIFHPEAPNNSEYKAIWLGLEGKSSNDLYNRKRFTIKFENDIRLSRYTAIGTWTLRDDLKQPNSFKHYTFLGELESAINLLFNLHRNISTGAGCQLTLQKSLKGEDILFFSNGDIASTQLNGVNGRRFMCFFLLNIKL